MMTKTNSEPTLTSQPDEFLGALQQMDVGRIHELLDENLTYQEFSKGKYVQMLYKVLECFLISGDTFLEIRHGRCCSETCNLGFKGFLLTGNKSGKYMNVMIEEKEGKITDIFECDYFKCADGLVSGGEQIYIDPDRAPF